MTRPMTVMTHVGLLTERLSNGGTKIQLSTAKAETFAKRHTGSI